MGEVVHGLGDDVGAEGEAECAEGFVTVGDGQVGFHCDEFRRRRLKVVFVLNNFALFCARDRKNA